MSLTLRIALTLAAAVGPFATALAADYDPPIFAEQPAEYVPVEVGSGWYLRGDVSYTFDNPYQNDFYAFDPLVSYEDDFTPVSGSIGIGYHFNDFLRGELNLGMLPAGESSLDYLTVDDADVVTSSVSMSTDNELWTGMANVYADLGTFVGITPYVGAGIGMVYNKRTFNRSQDYVDPDFVDIDFSDDQRHYDWAYSLGAGLSYAVTQNVSMSLGYEYFSSPGAEYALITGGDSYAIEEGLDFHQIKLGMRYDLW